MLVAKIIISISKKQWKYLGNITMLIAMLKTMLTKISNAYINVNKNATRTYNNCLCQRKYFSWMTQSIV